MHCRLHSTLNGKHHSDQMNARTLLLVSSLLLLQIGCTVDNTEKAMAVGNNVLETDFSKGRFGKDPDNNIDEKIATLKSNIAQTKNQSGTVQMSIESPNITVNTKNVVNNSSGYTYSGYNRKKK